MVYLYFIFQNKAMESEHIQNFFMKIYDKQVEVSTILIHAS